MGDVHIYVAAGQPATAYVDDSFDPPMEGGYPADKMIFCDGCDECWPASQMVVQCYYDGRRFWCANGHGCKDSARIAAHKERTRYRRSEAQKMRHALKEPHRD
jgi:hypothetical protein